MSRKQRKLDHKPSHPQFDAWMKKWIFIDPAVFPEQAVPVEAVPVLGAQIKYDIEPRMIVVLRSGGPCMRVMMVLARKAMCEWEGPSGLLMIDYFHVDGLIPRWAVKY